jgi:hypothetical protein
MDPMPSGRDAENAKEVADFGNRSGDATYFRKSEQRAHVKEVNGAFLETEGDIAAMPRIAVAIA